MFNFSIFLGSFLNDWWNDIRKFFHEMDSVVRILVITLLFLLGLLALIRCFKPMYKPEKNKIRVLPMIAFVLFTGLAFLITFI